MKKLYKAFYAYARVINGHEHDYTTALAMIEHRQREEMMAGFASGGNRLFVKACAVVAYHRRICDPLQVPLRSRHFSCNNHAPARQVREKILA